MRETELVAPEGFPRFSTALGAGAAVVQPEKLRLGQHRLPRRVAYVADPQLARRLHDAAYLTGNFVLRSGARSSHYFDKYRSESDPALLRELAEVMVSLLPPDTEGLAGLELGGVPLATVMSQASGLPTLFVRKEAKPYGTAQLAEGGPVAGRRLVVVEDVVTSGGQVIESARELRALGATVQTVVCAIDREAGGEERLSEKGLELRSAFRASELEAARTGA